jgi:hypothetical protein
VSKHPTIGTVPVTTTPSPGPLLTDHQIALAGAIFTGIAALAAVWSGCSARKSRKEAKRATERTMESIRRVALDQRGDGQFAIKNGSGGTITRLTIVSAIHTESGGPATNMGIGPVAAHETHYSGSLGPRADADFQARFVN